MSILDFEVRRRFGVEWDLSVIILQNFGGLDEKSYSQDVLFMNTGSSKDSVT